MLYVGRHEACKQDENNAVSLLNLNKQSSYYGAIMDSSLTSLYFDQLLSYKLHNLYSSSLDIIKFYGGQASLSRRIFYRNQSFYDYEKCRIKYNNEQYFSNLANISMTTSSPDDEFDNLIDCSYLQCMNDNSLLSAPFYTASGTYECRESLCRAFRDYADISNLPQAEADDSCATILDINVCTEDGKLISHKQACNLKKACYLHSFNTCNDRGCTEIDCGVQVCESSFRRRYCSLMNTCYTGTMQFYSSVTDFCANNPWKTRADVFLVPNEELESDWGDEIHDSGACCELNTNRYFCDSKTSYSNKLVNTDCSTPVTLEPLQLANSLFHNDASGDICINFSACMTEISDDVRGNGTFCLKNGNHYRNQRDFCEANADSYAADKENFLSNNLHPLSGKCETKKKLGCQIKTCTETLGGTSKCSVNYRPLLTSSQVCEYKTIWNLDFLQCEGRDCTLEECLEKRHTEEKPVYPARNPIYDVILNTAADVAAFLEAKPCVEMYELIYVGSGDSEAINAALESLGPFVQCWDRVDLTCAKICGKNPSTFEMVLYEGTSEFFALLGTLGITENYEDHYTLAPDYTDSEQCYLLCAEERKSACHPTTGEYFSAWKSCRQHIGDTEYNSFTFCYSFNGEQRNCRKSECCGTEANKSNSNDYVCTNKPFLFTPKYEFCLERKKLEDQGINVEEVSDSDYTGKLREIPQHTPICTNGLNFYVDADDYCYNGYIDEYMYGYGLEPIPCPAPCDRESCCALKCDNYTNPTILFINYESYKIFQNACFASCHTDDPSVISMCGNSNEQECEARYCLSNSECAYKEFRPVCGDNGQVYINKCEANCLSVNIVGVCRHLQPPIDGEDIMEICSPLCEELYQDRQPAS